MKRKRQNAVSILFFIMFFFVFVVYAEEADPNILKDKIAERNNQIKQLEEEIKQYNIEVTNAGKEAKTLQSTIKTLDLTKKKLSADINLTNSKINKTSLVIEELDNEIDSAEENISLNKKAIIETLQKAQFTESSGLLASLLSRKNLGDVWSQLDNAKYLRETIREKTEELSQLKIEMEQKQNSLSKEKNNLLSFNKDLTGKKIAVESTANEKNNLLKQTKNKEQTFKELVKTKEEQKAIYEKEVFDYESQLNYLIDKSSYPSPREGLLSWPLDDIYITQRFGKTVGAEKLYTSGSHNGVDFRASVGTRVKNVLSGTVVGTGNTDIYPGCYSFGKWVLVRHDNGLSTIYAHLSSISVSSGQTLSTGDIIGYSGNTGYSTGPHLHITVYATQGVKIQKFTQSRGCKEATIPLADIRAYLDPLNYFPNI